MPISNFSIYSPQNTATKQPSPIATKLVTLLENSRELAITGQNRALSLDVLDACKILAKQHNIKVDDDAFNHLALAIKDKMPQHLKEDFDALEETIVISDMDH
jgi:hypothetical protein